MWCSSSFIFAMSSFFVYSFKWINLFDSYGTIQGLSNYTKYVWLKMIPYIFYTFVVQMMFSPTYKPGQYDSINDIDVKHVVVKVVRNAVHVRTMKNTNTHARTHTKRKTKLWSYSCTYWNIRYTFITLLSYTLTATDRPTDRPTHQPTHCVCVCVPLIWIEWTWIRARTTSQTVHTSALNLHKSIYHFSVGLHFSFSSCQSYFLLLPATLSSHHYRPLQI